MTLKIVWLGCCALALLALQFRTLLGTNTALLAFFTLCCIALGLGLWSWMASRKG